MVNATNLFLDSVLDSRLYTEVVIAQTDRRLLKIGEVARRSGVGVEALRFYERSGLLEPATRTSSGYRLYGEEALERLAFIKKAQSVGFSLDEIGRIIEEAAEGRRPCADVRRMAADRLAALERKIDDLERYRDELRETVEAWETEGERDGVVCGLIEGLATPHREEEQ